MTIVQERKPSRRARRRAERAAAGTDVEVFEPTALTAAAVDVRTTGGYQQNARWGGTDWQQEGWLHYDNCPEFHKGVISIAGNLSRARLIGVEMDPATGDPMTTASDDVDVKDIMSRLFDGPSGQSQALMQMGKHDTVAGDMWILASDNPDLDGETWQVLGTTEVTQSGRSIQIQQMNGQFRELDLESELLFRLYQMHPKNRWDADAPTRSLLPVLRELASLTAMVSATVKSRLASAGILWIPDDIVLPKQLAGAGYNTRQRSDSSGAEAWLDLITEAMTAPIADPDSASAVVPLVAVVQGNMIDKISHMEFGRDLDGELEPLRQACVTRIAIGLELPPELLTGTGDVNHWTSWQIDESNVRTFISPKLERYCAALTKLYLHPALLARGKNPSNFAVYFDVSKLLPRQINTDNATALHEVGLISDAVYVEALGFAKSDMPSDDEQLKHLVLDMLKRGQFQTLFELAPTLATMFPMLKLQPPAAPGPDTSQVPGMLDANAPAALPAGPNPPASPGKAPTNQPVTPGAA